MGRGEGEEEGVEALGAVKVGASFSENDPFGAEVLGEPSQDGSEVLPPGPAVGLRKGLEIVNLVQGQGEGKGGAGPG